MDSLFYLTKHTIINKIKRAIKKPSAIAVVLFWIIYLIVIASYAKNLTFQIKLDSPEGLTIILTYLLLLGVPGNIITFVRKKGIVFKLSDVHFLFNSPLNPKLILVYRYLPLLLNSTLLNVLIFIGAITLFKLNFIQLVLIGLLIFVVDNIFEISLMLNLYANESLSDKQNEWLRKVAWSVIIFLCVYMGYLFFYKEPSLSVLALFPFEPLLLCIPIIGWEIAAYHLIILGPTTLNVICSILYLVTVVVFVYSAIKMKCTGAYYEEASDYAKIMDLRMKRSKKGETVLSNKPKKFRRASISYKGTGAKAIFYRQLLEYKKNRFFIFGFNNLIILAISCFLAITLSKESLSSEIIVLIIAGISAYVSFIFSGNVSLWSKELEKPYLFLIPAKPYQKLWYATLIEHIRSLIDGCVLSIIVGVSCHLSISYIILCILLYLVLMAVRLNIHLISEAILGDSLGNIGRQLVKMLFQLVILLTGIWLVSFCINYFNIAIVLVLVIIYAIAVCLLLSMGSVKMFAKYEENK